jgi:RNA polymerase sigma-70 factor (ECF subfamily)
VNETNHDRFEDVYRHTYGQILGYALRRCASPEDAADIVAETYTIAWRRAADLPKGEQARLWLYGIARRVLANHRRGELRRASHHAQLLAQTQRLYAVHPEPDPGSPEVARAFGQLAEPDREVLALSAWEGLTPGEIAEVLGCSRNAARIRLHRARRRLAFALKDAGVPLGDESAPVKEESR